jgi:hypothetical protein
MMVERDLPELKKVCLSQEGMRLLNNRVEVTESVIRTLVGFTVQSVRFPLERKSSIKFVCCLIPI